MFDKVKPLIITSYQQAVQRREFAQLKVAENRFKDIQDREDRSDIPLSALLPLAVKKAYLPNWKNVICNKSSWEFTIYPMLISELRPKTIIELGALNGGSALWLADLLTQHDIQGHIYSVDIDYSLLDPVAKADKRITFIEGDCSKISEVLPTAFLKDLPHPWLIIEDCHVSLTSMLNYFHEFGLQAEDYIIVEDTNKDALVVRSDPSLGELYLPESKIKDRVKKMDELREWLENHPCYKIDTYYLDIFGYNGSKNWNSVFTRFYQDDSATSSPTFFRFPANRRIVPNGLSYYKIAPNEHSCYAAVLSNLDTSFSIQSLRKQTAEFIATHAEMLKLGIQDRLEESQGNLKSIGALIEATKTDAHAQDIEIMTLSFVLNRPIVVLNQAGTMQNAVVSQLSNDPIFIYNNGKTAGLPHFDAFLVNEGQNAKEIFANICLALNQTGSIDRIAKTLTI